MTPFSFRVAGPPQATYTISVEPVHNALLSLSLLGADLSNREVEPWARQTSATLPPDLLRRNRLVFEILGEVLVPDAEYPDFSAYLDALDAAPATQLRDRLLARLSAPWGADADAADARTLLADAHAFAERFAQLSAGVPEDLALAHEAHALLNQPPALQRLLVGHLSELYELALGAKWERQLESLAGFVLVLQQRPLPAGTAAETIRAFLGRELPDWLAAQLDGVQYVVFVISPHVWLHAARFGSPDTIWVFARAHPSTLAIRTAPIKRAELLRPLQALADDTRLFILELLARNGEMPTQEIIAQLDQSQPNVSRHLKQLVSAGFVEEQRADGANKRYRLNPKRVDTTFWTLRQFASAENYREVAPSARDEQPLALRRFLDLQGRVTARPAKRQDQDLVLAYLGSKFERGREYSEREVNDIINSWHTYRDHATIRRELYNARLLDRTPDGARYWRPEQPAVSSQELTLEDGR